MAETWRDSWKFLMMSPKHKDSAPTRQQRRRIALEGAKQLAKEEKEMQRMRRKHARYKAREAKRG